MENKHVIKQNEEITINSDLLFKLLQEAYREGYAIYDIVEAGLESFDSEGYAAYVMLGLELKEGKVTRNGL